MEYILALTFLLTPLYVWRFSFLHIPLNFLMVCLALVWLVFLIILLIRGKFRDFFRFSLKHDRLVLALAALFFLAGLISLFAGGVTQEKLGQFIVLFVQPIGTYFIAAYEVRHR